MESGPFIHELYSMYNDSYGPLLSLCLSDMDTYTFHDIFYLYKHIGFVLGLGENGLISYIHLFFVDKWS